MGKSKSRQQRRQTGSQAGANRSADARRQEKRAQFEAPRRSRLLPIIAGIAVVAAVASVAIYFAAGRGGATATATTASATGADVTMPMSKVNDGKAHFFTYDANGVTVKYFVLADKKGVVRAALDACEVCYPRHLGYHQSGDSMVCNNCGKSFRSDQINVITGGCNPIPLTRSVKGSTLTISTADLQNGAQYFQ
jgi:uncharacterized membrane protein